MLTLGAGEATRLSPSGKPQNSAPAVRREVARLVAEANGLPSATIATDIAMCSFLYRNTFSWELAFGVGSSELDPKFGRKGNGLYESREVCTPALFVRDNVGQVLQRRVSSNRKDAGDRLCVPTCRMQRQDALAIASLTFTGDTAGDGSEFDVMAEWHKCGEKHTLGRHAWSARLPINDCIRPAFRAGMRIAVTPNSRRHV